MKPYFLILIVCLFKFNCMPTQSNNTPACIQDFIAQVEAKTFVFSALGKEYGHPIDENVIFQFSVANVAPCFQSVTFIKGYGQDRLENLGLKLAPGYETNLGELSKGFGEFRIAPPDPSGGYAAIAKYKTASTVVQYAIIVEDDHEITSKTTVRSISVRLDYQD
jgi:hypothetical protein